MILSGEDPVDHDAVAAREHVADLPGHCEPFVRRPVEPVAEARERDPARLGRIPHDDVAVAARRDHALLRIQPEDARRRRARDLDESLGRERGLACDELPEAERQSRADAGEPRRHLREITRDGLLVAIEPQVAVIGRIRVEIARAQAAQERGAIARRAQRRRHHVAQRVRALVARALEEQVVRADLGVDSHSALPRRRDLRERPRAGDVHDVGRRARDLGEREEAVDALGLERDRPAARERVEAEPALRHQAPREKVDRPAVLAVGEDDHAELGGLLQDGQRDVVLGHDAELDVGEPELDAADAELGDGAHVARAIRERLPDDGVEREIDVGVGQLVGERPAGRLGRALARERIDEGERRRRAAEERRAGVVADAAEDMRVHVDRPGQHEAPGGVDDVRTGALDLADVHDQCRPRRARPP